MQRPDITVQGSLVIWRQGAVTKRHRTNSHEAAIDLAARLEGEFEAEQTARAESAAVMAARGVPVVQAAQERAGEERAAEPPTPVEEDSSPLLSPHPDVPAVTVTSSFDAEEGRVVVDFNAEADTDVWRCVGASKSTFKLPAGESSRRWKGEPGDAIDIRHGDADGAVIYAGVVPS